LRCILHLRKLSRLSGAPKCPASYGIATDEEIKEHLESLFSLVISCKRNVTIHAPNHMFPGRWCAYTLDGVCTKFICHHPGDPSWERQYYTYVVTQDWYIYHSRYRLSTSNSRYGRFKNTKKANSV
jgi:hypothetical protein